MLRQVELLNLRQLDVDAVSVGIADAVRRRLLPVSASGLMAVRARGARTPSRGVLHSRRRADVLLACKVRRFESGLMANIRHSRRVLSREGIINNQYGFASPEVQDFCHAMATVKPKVVITHALFLPTEAYDLLTRRFPKMLFVVRCHSELNFLATERNSVANFKGLLALAQKRPNLRVSCVSLHACRVVAAMYGLAFNGFPGRAGACSSLVYLPNVYGCPMGKPRRKPGSPLKVSLFCAVRPLKNMVTQAAAAGLLARERPVELHVILERAEGADANYVAQLRELCAGTRLKLMEHPWQPNPRFQRLVQRMDLGLQVSYTESFNYVALDHLTKGIPVVGSDAIDYLPKSFRALADDSLDIARRAREMLSHYSAYSRQAIQVARTVMARNETTFIQAIRALLKEAEAL